MEDQKVLDVTAKQEVKYCIPLWLRDLQIEQNNSRVKSRLNPEQKLKDEPIALVCFGPSLNDTWQELKNFKYIMSCSGAHKFLIDRGIIPTWHVEVDPREHKVTLMGKPHTDVNYLIASTCSPKLLDHLESFNVTLWHVFDGEEDAKRSLPHDEWALTGGCSVGLRCMTLARFMGFTDQHIFGMDGSEGKSGKHADVHPSQAKATNTTIFNGVEYKTTPAFLQAANETFHELNQMPDVRPVFYGEGLVQAMAHFYKPNYADKGKAIIGYVKPKLISDEYCRLNIELHRTNLAYGVGGGRHTNTVLEMYKQIKNQVPNPSVLDYGCGKGMLAKSLPMPIWEYDPAVEGKNESPRPADLVVCTDVLEHIELDHLALVLYDLKRCTRGLGFFVIDTGPAMKKLPDGRNTHLIQKDLRWWKKHLEKFFTVHSIQPKGRELFCVVGPQTLKLSKGKVKAYVIGNEGEVADKNGQLETSNAGGKG